MWPIFRFSMGADQSAHSVPRQRPILGMQPMPPAVRDLHLAVMQNDLQRLQALIKIGADVNYPWSNPMQPSAKDGCTALIQAVSLNHGEIAKALIEAGADVDYMDHDGVWTLHKAAYHGRGIIAKMLIDAGANVHQIDRDGNTALHICAKNGFVHNNSKCVLTLLECGAAPNAKNKRGAIPLHYAATWGVTEIVSLLSEWRSDVDCFDDDYLTPFNYCVIPIVAQQRQKPSALLREVFRRQLPSIKRLLQAGCDSVGFASWLNEQLCLHAAVDDEEFTHWWRSNTPESLKQLCRVFIQARLGFTSVRHKYCIRKVRKFDIPETLKEYLNRRLVT